MQWKPYLNALCATGYIGCIVLLMNFLQTYKSGKPDNIIDGLGALSLLVFSVAVMGFLFFYQPAVLLIENKKKEAVSYFIQTLVIFGVVTFVIFTFISLQ